MSLRDALQELDHRAEHLHSESDELDQALAQVEVRLNAAQVRVSEWLDRVFDEDALAPGATQGWRIGYTKIGGSWRIAVKPVQIWLSCEPSADYQDVQYCVVRDCGLPIPVSRAPTKIRASAAMLAEGLIIALIRRVSGLVDSFQVTGLDERYETPVLGYQIEELSKRQPIRRPRGGTPPP